METQKKYFRKNHKMQQKTENCVLRQSCLRNCKKYKEKVTHKKLNQCKLITCLHAFLSINFNKSEISIKFYVL